MARLVAAALVLLAGSTLSMPRAANAATLSPEATAALVQRLQAVPPGGGAEEWGAVHDRVLAATALAGGEGDEVIAALARARDHDPYWDVYRAAKLSLAEVAPERFGLPHEEEAQRFLGVLLKVEEPPEGVDAFLRAYRERCGGGNCQWAPSKDSFAPKADIERARDRLVAIGAPAAETLIAGCRGKCVNGDRLRSTLVAIGRDAVPALVTAVERRDDSWERWRTVVGALGAIGDPRALSALRKVADGDDRLDRQREAQQAIAKIQAAVGG